MRVNRWIKYLALQALTPYQSNSFPGAKVIFDPYPLNQLDQEDEDEDEDGHRHDKEDHYTHLYPVIRIVRPGSTYPCVRRRITTRRIL